MRGKKNMQPLNHMHVQHCGNVTKTLHGTTPAGK
jgi:hypothetical protein